MLIDCDDCAVRDLACADCVVTVLLGGPPGLVDVDDTEVRAIEALADSGLVPRLRLVPLGPPAPAPIEAPPPAPGRAAG